MTITEQKIKQLAGFYYLSDELILLSNNYSEVKEAFNYSKKIYHGLYTKQNFPALIDNIEKALYLDYSSRHFPVFALSLLCGYQGANDKLIDEIKFFFDDKILTFISGENIDDVTKFFESINSDNLINIKSTLVDVTVIIRLSSILQSLKKAYINTLMKFSREKLLYNTIDKYIPFAKKYRYNMIAKDLEEIYLLYADKNYKLYEKVYTLYRLKFLEELSEIYELKRGK